MKGIKDKYISLIDIYEEIMEYTFEKLNKDNFNKYFDYLLLAIKLEAELMCSSYMNKGK